MRQKTFTNGGSYTFTYNTTIRLSEFINRYDVECRGGDGQPGTSCGGIEIYGVAFNSSSSMKEFAEEIRSTTAICWWIRMDKNTPTSPLNKTLTIHSNNYMCNIGGRGHTGSTNTKRNLTTTGSISVIVGSGSIAGNYRITKWIDMYNNGSQIMRLLNTDCSNNGNTGGTSSFGSLVFATGGAGGIGAGVSGDKNSGNIYPNNNIKVNVWSNIRSGYYQIQGTFYIPHPKVNAGYVKLTNIYYK